MEWVIAIAIILASASVTQASHSMRSHYSMHSGGGFMATRATRLERGTTRRAVCPTCGAVAEVAE